MSATRKPLAKAEPVTGAEQMVSKTIRAHEVLWVRAQQAGFARKIDFSEAVRRALSIGLDCMEDPAFLEAYIATRGVLHAQRSAAPA